MGHHFGREYRGSCFEGSSKCCYQKKKKKSLPHESKIPNSQFPLILQFKQESTLKKVKDIRDKEKGNKKNYKC